MLKINQSWPHCKSECCDNTFFLTVHPIQNNYLLLCLALFFRWDFDRWLEENKANINLFLTFNEEFNINNAVNYNMHHFFRRNGNPVVLKLKSDRAHPRYYPHKPSDYRPPANIHGLIMVLLCSKPES